MGLRLRRHFPESRSSGAVQRRVSWKGPRSSSASASPARSARFLSTSQENFEGVWGGSWQRLPKCSPHCPSFRLAQCRRRGLGPRGLHGLVIRKERPRAAPAAWNGEQESTDVTATTVQNTPCHAADCGMKVLLRGAKEHQASVQLPETMGITDALLSVGAFLSRIWSPPAWPGGTGATEVPLLCIRILAQGDRNGTTSKIAEQPDACEL